MNKRVLVTGGAGFIGRPCLTALVARGFEVHAVTRRTPPASAPGVLWHHGDLFKPVDVAALMERVRPSHLLHLAWTVSLEDHAHQLEWVRASLNLLQQFQRMGGERVVTSGSCAEYDWSYGYCSESRTPCNPATLYGVCKNALQNMTTAYASATQMRSAWARIFFTFGPHESPQRLVPSVIQPLLENRPVLTSHGEQLRDYLFVDDVADALTSLLDSDMSGPLNIGSGSPVALKEIIYYIADRLGGRELVQLGARPTGPGDQPLLVADTGRLTAEMQWRPRHSLYEGLDRTISWWQSTGH